MQKLSMIRPDMNTCILQLWEDEAVYEIRNVNLNAQANTASALFTVIMNQLEKLEAAKAA